MISRALILRTAALPPVERAVRRSRLFRPLVHRFIAGDTLEEAIQASQNLLSKGLKVTLDILGENTSSETEANKAKATYIEMLERIAQVPDVQKYAAGGVEGYEPLNMSIKLTQCGLDLGDDFAEKNLREVLAVAAKAKNFVRVDMEGSEYTERTVRLMEKVMAECENTGTVLQSYLYRTDDDVDLMVKLKKRTRLVKGAYLEPASVAYPEKAKVDEAYVRQAKKLIDGAPYPAIGTHDEAIINEIKRYVAEKNIDKASFEFQMLYGIRRDLQEQLVKEGFNVRIYVPFGDAWYPYFSRRLAERPANATFILKSLFKG